MTLATSFYCTRTDDDLVIETLPNGQVAFLRPATEPAEEEDALYVLTYAGRRALRMAELFGTDR